MSGKARVFDAMISLMTIDGVAACNPSVTIPTENNMLASDNFMDGLMRNRIRVQAKTRPGEDCKSIQFTSTSEQDTFRDSGLGSK